MPVTAPALNATDRPSARLTLAAWVVRTLARTDTSMPMKPAAPESAAPTAKPIATGIDRSHQTMAKMMTPAIAMVVYCRVR